MNIQIHPDTGVSLPAFPWERGAATLTPEAARPALAPRRDRILMALTGDWLSRHEVLRGAGAGATDAAFADVERLVSEGLAEVWHDQRTKQHIRRYRLTEKGAEAQRGLA